jgi:outer membrane protein TolC
MDWQPRRSRWKTNPVTSRARAVALAAVILSTPAVCRADDPPAPSISFRNAIELALEHSGVMGIAAINQWRARQSYEELHANYTPQLTVGSALGYSYGFPLTLEGSAPSVVNFNSVQSVFNVSLRNSMKAAKIEWRATSLDVQDKRNGVILDTALTYTQLDELSKKINSLSAAQKAAEKGEFISQQRLQEGVGSKLDLERSQLLGARIRLRIAEAEGQTDVLRQHLASLVGVQADSITLDPASVPTIPTVSQDEDLTVQALQNSLAVKEAEQKTAAANLRAEGERKATHLPTAELASQYAYLATFNNYDLYFKHYTANNLAAGLNVRFPLFNSVQKAKAEEAKAEAMVTSKQEDLTKEKVKEDTLQLQRSIRQLVAARDVAELEWEVSQGDLESTKARLTTGEVNMRDEQNAELDVDDKYAAYLDAEFELDRAELQLLRITGELQDWALPMH